MIPKECKRLAEVDFPIAVVSKHAAREKSIRHGHPSTLHLWWARRPLAACRAMLLGLLLPDPCDSLCPDAFKVKARELLPRLVGPVGLEDMDLRRKLLKFIADFADWDHSAQPAYLEVGRGLVQAAHPEETPLIVDPFAGGGSIPLEALRLGCEVFASDLNPVACLILKVMLEDIPRHGPELAEELRRVGHEIKKRAERELAAYYPKTPILPDNLKNGSFILLQRKENGFGYVAVGDVEKHLFEKQEDYSHYLQIEKGAEHGPHFSLMCRDWKTIEKAGARPLGLKWETPIAYLWARTISCESPRCGAEIPLVRSFWLCKKSNRRRALRCTVIRGEGGAPRVEFEVFVPVSEAEVAGGTVSRARAMCLCCGAVLPPERVRAQLSGQRGGADCVFDDNGHRVGGARLLAVVSLRPGETGRHYRLPTEHDYLAVRKAHQRLQEILDTWERDGRKGLCPIPDEAIPRTELRRIALPIYGIDHFRDMFTSRQRVALSALARGIATATMPGAVNHLLALSMDKTADLNNAHTRWKSDAECPVQTLARHDIGMSWDFAETVSVSEASGSFFSAYERTADAIASVYCGSSLTAAVESADACAHPLPDHSASVWFTDPPYYDSVPYAHLSDFFHIWMRRCLVAAEASQLPVLAPKREECVVDRPHRLVPDAKTAAHYEKRIGTAMSEGKRLTKPDGVACVVFAHKTTEGWEALLSGMIHGGWVITSSWPITTEMQSRLNARDNASLAASVHLVCRPRPEDAPVGDWADVLRELPVRVGDWMERLQAEKIRGADLVFACIGPALEIYSRYSKVVDPNEIEIPLGGDATAKEPHKRGYLSYVWEVVGRTALEQVLGTSEARARNGAAGALEEDARLTALFLWTLQSTNGQNGAAADRGEDAEDDAGEEDESSAPRGKAKGFSLVFDVVRRFAQPLGINLPLWENRIVTTEKGVVRLLPVSERARQLFGNDGVGSAADWIEDDPVNHLQLALFPEMEQDQVPRIRGRGRHKVTIDPSAVDGESMHKATTLDRVHAAMLLQAGGQANALRALIGAEQDRSPDFLRLANALSALYPKESEEKRLLDAMLLAVPR